MLKVALDNGKWTLIDSFLGDIVRFLRNQGKGGLYNENELRGCG